MSVQEDPSRDGDGVRFLYEGDTVTAVDIETGVASFGESKPEALAMLAEALELHEGGGEPIEDEDDFLRSIGIDPDDVEPTKPLPDFLQ